MEKLVLMDFDQVTLSSTNRHATATLRDVGTPKVAAVKKVRRGGGGRVEGGGSWERSESP